MIELCLKHRTDMAKPALRKIENAENLTYGKVEETIEEALDDVMDNTAVRIAAQSIVTVIKILAPV